MALIYFLSESRIKDFTNILGNVDAKLISPLVPTIADMWVKSRIGSYFYDDLLTKYNAQTLTSDEETLVSLIQQSLLWRAAADVAITTSAQLTNKGPQEQNGINSAASDLAKIGLITKHYTQKAEFYDARIAEYLRLNKDLFPKFIANENNDKSLTDIVPDTKKGYNRDITFF